MRRMRAARLTTGASTIFPRSEKATDAARVNNDQANALLAKLADGKNILFLDINKSFLEADGTLSKDIMPDLLHPNAKGYAIWADALVPEMQAALKK